MYLYFKSLLSGLIYKVLVKLIEAKSVSSSAPLSCLRMMPMQRKAKPGGGQSKTEFSR